MKEANIVGIGDYTVSGGNKMSKDISSGAMKVVYGLIGLFLFLTLAAALAPTILNETSNLATALDGTALGSIFGIVLPILIVIGLLVAAIKYTHVSK
jgi:hypothetical protein